MCIRQRNRCYAMHPTDRLERPLSDAARYDVRYVPAATGPSVWDDPFADQLVHRFMPPDRKHPPMLGVIDLDAARPTPSVLQRVVVSIAEDVKAGRYGSCSLVYCSQDEDTRTVIGDIAESQNVAVFLCSTYDDLMYAEPVGDLTARDHETLDMVLEAGGTVNALDLSTQVGIEKTAAGNRLVSLQKKGYVFRVERPHPAGDLFIDPRSLVHGKADSSTGPEGRAFSPTRTTIAAIDAARRGDLVELGNPADAIAELNLDD